MAQVELQCGPFRVVSLMSSEAVARPRAGARLGRGRGRQVDDGHRRDPRGASMRRVGRGGRGRCSAAWRGCGVRLRGAGDAAEDEDPDRVRRGLADLDASRRSASSSRPTTTASKVRFSFGGSSDLVAQIQQGAPADVFASADTAEHGQGDGRRSRRGRPGRLRDQHPGDRRAAGQPGGGRRPSQDLAKPGLKVVVCAPEVPCGAATQKVEEAAGSTSSR